MKETAYNLLITEGLKRYKESQFAFIPQESEIDYSFSESFEKKMKKLIEKNEKKNSYVHLTVAKKIAILVSILIIAFTASLSIKAVRESFLDFLYKIFPDHTSVFYSSTVQDDMTEYFVIPELPDGFVLCEEGTLINGCGAQVNWQNENGAQIVFSQTDGATTGTFNSEDAEVIEKVINDINILYCAVGNQIICTWNEKGYFMQLIYPSFLTDDYMYRIIGRLEETKPVPEEP